MLSTAILSNKQNKKRNKNDRKETIVYEYCPKSYGAVTDRTPLAF